MGLPNPKLNEVNSKESSCSIPCESKASSSDVLSCMHQETAVEALHDILITPRDSPSTASSETPASTLHSQTSISQETIPNTQDSLAASPETSTPLKSEPSPIPHPPTFATCRSLSAPSLMANTSSNNSTVLLRTDPSDHDSLYFIQIRPLEQRKCPLFQCCQYLCIGRS